MEGLEVSVLSFKNVFNDDNFGRIDAEYFGKLHLTKNDILKRRSYKKINEFAVVTDGEHGSPDLDNDSGIIYLSGNNIKENTIDFENVRYCSLALHEKNQRSALKLNSVLISIVGTVGKASVVYKDVVANTDRNVATIKEISNEINSYFLSVFMNSKYGTFQTQRFSTGNVQPLLNLLQVKSIIVPILNIDCQIKIENIVKLTHSKLELSKTLYTEAENLLLAELGLNDWQPTKSSSNSVSFSNSFLLSGRLDAEYYQPKYDELYNYLKRKETKTLGSIAKIKKSIEPGSNAYQETGIPFVRVSNITKYGLSEPEIHLNRAEYEATDLKPKKDTILLTKDGTVGTAYKVEKDLDIITSGAILHLTIKDKDFLPDYVTLILNSIVVSTQAERDAGGSIIQHWKPSEIEQVIIPKLSINIQKEISEKIQKSFVLKTESRKLLELAKQAVEIAIEKGEDEGIKILNSNI